MAKYVFEVEVETHSWEQAVQVMAERILHDEDYGFSYQIDYSVKDSTSER